MRFFGNKLNIRHRQTVAGLLIGLTITLTVLVVAAPALAPSGLEAASPNDACFTRMDCSSAMRNEEQCKDSRGCCKDDRCFVPSSSCPREGDERTGFCYARNPPFQLSVNFGNKTSVVDLGDYISTVYKYAVGIGGLLAAVMLMIGGFLYLTAADSERISRGKQFIVDALTGLVVILGAYLLLNTINPDLISLSLPKVPVIKRQVFVGCGMTEMCAKCGETYYVTNKFLEDMQAGKTGQGAMAPAEPGSAPNPSRESCYAQYVNTTGTDQAAKCTGKGCSRLNPSCSDNAYRCRKPTAPTEAPGCGETESRAIAAANAPPPSGGDASAGGAPAAPPPLTYACFACLSDGQNCSPNGANDKCCGGFCGKDKCTAGQPGDGCNDDKDCVTGICQTNWGNSCSLGEAGSPCADNSECKSGYKCNTEDKNVCTPGEKFAKCASNSECNTGFCNTDYDICMLSEHEEVLEPGITGCSDNAECTRVSGGTLNYCSADGDMCTNGANGSPCDRDSDCASGHCITSAGTPDIEVCTPGTDGSACDDDSDCQSGICFTEGDFNVCVSGGPGSRCSNRCASGYQCLANKCVAR